MKNPIVALLLSTIAACGYHFSPKEIIAWNPKGDQDTAYSCGNLMRVSSSGWGSSTFDITFTDKDGLTHDIYGTKAVTVSDIPEFVDAPFGSFSDSEYVPGERYRNNADGALGSVVAEGDIVKKGDDKARLINGKWTPVRIPNPACAK